jgi:nucleotide-binding universal stress UspA family protein
MEIIVGVDGSRSAANALEWATGAAQAWAAELLVVTVVEPGTDAAQYERVLLTDWSVPAQRAKVPFRTEVRTGDPRLELLDLAASTRADLTVVGAGRARWFPAMHLGSTSHGVAQHAEAPVAVITSGSAFDAAHLVVGVDGTEGAAAACRWAAWAAGATGGDATAVYAWQRSPARVAAHADAGREPEADCRQWAKELEAAGVLAEVLAVEAGPVDALLGAVASVHAGMLVLGTRGEGGFLSLRLGSVAMRALQRADVPVILVPPGN